MFLLRIWLGKESSPHIYSYFKQSDVLNMQDYLEDLLDEVTEECDDELSEDYSEL